MKSPRQNKYNARRTNGYASKAEARRAAELKLLEKAGVITSLVEQPKFYLVVEEKLICTYTPDFRYTDRGGFDVVEEVKGYRQRDYKIRAKLFQALYPDLVFKEVK